MDWELGRAFLSLDRVLWLCLVNVEILAVLHG